MAKDVPGTSIQTPSELAFDVPGMEGDGIATRGGFDYPDAEKETANSESGLPLLPTTWNPGPGDPGEKGTVPWPSIDAKDRTIPFDLNRK